MFVVVHPLPYTISMQCPRCGFEITDDLVLRESAAIRGRKGRGAAKSRDRLKMREAGRLGGLAKARNRALARKQSVTSATAKANRVKPSG
jgi:general stress protein YciG